MDYFTIYHTYGVRTDNLQVDGHELSYYPYRLQVTISQQGLIPVTKCSRSDTRIGTGREETMQQAGQNQVGITTGLGQYTE